MMAYIRFIPLLSFFTLIQAFVICLTGCSEGPAIENGIVEETASLPEEVMLDFTMKQMNRSNVEWFLESEKASIFDNREKILLDNPRIKFYKDGKLDSHLSAESGLLYPETKSIIVTGNVVVASVDSVLIEADSLLWDNETERLSTESAVHIVDGASEMWGEGMEADAALDIIILKKNVRGKTDNFVIREDEF